MKKCSDCVFRGKFQDMGASCDVCNRYSDLTNAIEACEKSEECRHRFTTEEAKKIVIERAGSLPLLVERKARKLEAIGDATSDFTKTINDIKEAFAPLIVELQKILEDKK